MLDIINENVDNVTLINLSSLTRPYLILDSRKKVLLRVGQVKGQSVDAKTNYYRFKIYPIISKYDFISFTIFYKESHTSYILSAKEIFRLKTLALRYRNDSEGMKWRGALNGWTLLK